jgi:uncharacterized protein YegL
MSDYDQIPFVERDPEAPDEMHLACVVLLDTSSSMEQSGAIHKLNEALRYFVSHWKSGSYEQRKCIDIVLVSFGPDVKIIQPFTPAEYLEVPTLSGAGMTPMGEAILIAMDMAEERKKKYKESNVPYHRPWIFCITDGAPNDDYVSAAARLKEWEAGEHGIAYCAGTKGYKYDIVSEIFDPKRIFDVDNENYLSLFEFLGNSLAAGQGSLPGEKFKVDLTKDVKPHLQYEYNS